MSDQGKSQTTENALLLLEAVTKALASGCPHYDQYGNRLSTAEEVLTVLLRDGNISFQDAP